MNSNDYLMREIENMVQVIAKTFFQKMPDDIALFDSEGEPLESGLLYVSVMALLQHGEINRAENLIYDKVTQEPSEENLAVAIRFYSRLNELSDDALTQGDFTRQEIIDGLTEVKAICEGL